MSGLSLGLIETVGLAVAVEAADAAMKSANVDLVGYELTKGGGLVTVKFTGDVGAVNAAVSAGVAAAGRIGQVYAWKVIARTATGIDRVISSVETCGAAPVQPVAPVSEQKAIAIPVVNIEAVVAQEGCMAETALPPSPVVEPESTSVPAAAQPLADDDKKSPRSRGKGPRR